MKSDFKHGSLHFILLSSMARLELGGKLIEASFNEKDQHNREWMAATELKKGGGINHCFEWEKEEEEEEEEE